MILVLSQEATHDTVDELLQRLTWMGFLVRPTHHEGRFAIAIIHGGDKKTDFAAFTSLPHVEKVTPLSHPYKLAAREFSSKPTIFDYKGTKIGTGYFTLMVGPCSIESKEQLQACAEAMVKDGIRFLRGGAFKPRTSPYSFQGMGEEGLKIMRDVADEHNLLTVSEVMDGDQIDLLCEYCDMLQVGARNMQNFTLLKKLGQANKPVFLKRGMSATYQDLLMSAEYILEKGNEHVILCERGIRTFESYSRNTLDIAAAPILQELSHLPVFIDPSHGVGIRKMVLPLAYASMAAGADGIMVEMHPHPDKAASDKQQTISLETFHEMTAKLKKMASLFNKQVN